MDEPQETDDSVGQVVVQLVDDAKAYAHAQLAMYRAIFAARLRAARVGIILGAVALATGTSALVVLFVGIVFALAKLVGAIAATAIVTIVIGGISAICGRIALKRLRRLFEPLK